MPDNSIKLGCLKIALIALLFLHTYAVWYDYRINYYVPPDYERFSRHPALQVHPDGNIAVAPSEPVPRLPRNVHQNPKVPMDSIVIPTPASIQAEPLAIGLGTVPVGRLPVGNSLEVLETSRQPTAMAIIALCLVVIYMILSLLTIIAVCGESYSLTYGAALFWSALVAFDVAAHLVTQENLIQYHFVFAFLTSLVLWAAKYMIEKDDVMLVGHTLL